MSRFVIYLPAKIDLLVDVVGVTSQREAITEAVRRFNPSSLGILDGAATYTGLGEFCIVQEFYADGAYWFHQVELSDRQEEKSSIARHELITPDRHSPVPFRGAVTGAPIGEGRHYPFNVVTP